MRSTRWPRRRTSRNPWAAVATLVPIALIAGLAALLTPPGDELTGRAYAVDGDTLRIGQTRIRLVGLDAVELEQACINDGEDWPCGRAARDFLRALVASQDTTCTSEGRDQYRRVLGRCRVGSADLGDSIVREGWALADLEYAVAIAEARLNRRGIWAGQFDEPSQWRRDHGEFPLSFWDWLMGLVGR
jgi:endonuclease YncB( thermonuclease family)